MKLCTTSQGVIFKLVSYLSVTCLVPWEADSEMRFL